MLNSQCMKRIMERRDRAVAPATAAPIDTAPARPTGTGMFILSNMPEWRVRDILRIFLKTFRTCACVNRCDSALDSEIYQEHHVLNLRDCMITIW